jgi:hypothetical protein
MTTTTFTSKPATTLASQCDRILEMIDRRLAEAAIQGRDRPPPR